MRCHRKHHTKFVDWNAPTHASTAVVIEEPSNSSGLQLRELAMTACQETSSDSLLEQLGNQGESMQDTLLEKGAVVHSGRKNQLWLTLAVCACLALITETSFLLQSGFFCGLTVPHKKGYPTELGTYSSWPERIV